MARIQANINLSTLLGFNLPLAIRANCKQTMQATFYDFEHRVTSLLLQIKKG